MKDIFTFKLETHSRIKETLLKEISSADATSSESAGDKIFRTDFYKGIGDDQMEILRDRKYFWILWNECSDFFDVFRKQYCVKSSRITNLWFQQYLNNDIHDWHVHANSNLSFIYFLELPDSKYATEFFDYEKRQVFKPNISEGDIAVFPSHIIHRSPQLKGNSRKTIISWNMSLDLVDTNLMS